METTKSKQYYLLTELIRDNAIAQIKALPLDGKTKVSITAAANKSDRQRGLQWVWYGDVVKSGVGGIEEETTKSVSIKAKRNFAMPVIFKNPEKYECFLMLYEIVKPHLPDPKFNDDFYHNHLHTEWFDTNEMAEFLTAFEDYYRQRGVDLSDPIDHKLTKSIRG